MTVMQTLHVPPDGWTVDEVPAGDVYREAGRFEDTVAVREPVPLTFRLGDLFD